MTSAPVESATLAAAASLAGLRAAAARAGLAVRSSASWPRTEADVTLTALAGFIESTFSPLIAEVAGRALRELEVPGSTIAIMIITTFGDATSASRVASAVDAGTRVSPLLFFQSVPNAVAGYLAARWRLTGPVVCVTGTTAGMEVAALLIDDRDADEVLVVRVDQAMTDGGEWDRAAAVVVTNPA